MFDASVSFDPRELSRTLAPLAEKIVAGLADQGWCLLEDWLPESVPAGLRADLTRLEAEGELRRAGIGHGSLLQQRAAIRSDLIHWLNPALPASIAQVRFFRVIATLRGELGRRMFLPLREIESHFAVYPVGAAYARHVDRFRDSNQRQISFVLYLNEGWSAEDGGLLRLYSENSPDVIEKVVVPLMGRTAFFLSGSVPHEVTEARRTRRSLTGWMRSGISSFRPSSSASCSSSSTR